MTQMMSLDQLFGSLYDDETQKLIDDARGKVKDEIKAIEAAYTSKVEQRVFRKIYYDITDVLHKSSEIGTSDVVTAALEAAVSTWKAGVALQKTIEEAAEFKKHLPAGATLPTV